MQVNRDSWFAKRVFERNPYANDECSFFRSFLMVMFSGFWIGLKWTALAIAVIGPIAFGIKDMQWPSLLFNELPSLEAFLISNPVIGFVPGIIIVLSSVVLYTIVPAAAATYFTFIGVVWCLKKASSGQTRERKESSAAGVLLQGIKNKVGGFCRKLEVDGDYIRSEIVRGTRILYDMGEGRKVEAYVVESRVNHRDGLTELDINIPQLEYDWLSSVDGMTTTFCMTLKLKGDALREVEILPSK